MVKICSKCNISKDVSLFNNNRSRKDGKCQYCKECSRRSDKDLYKKNHSTKIEYRKKNLEKIRRHSRAKIKEYRILHNEEVREYKKQYKRRKRASDNIYNIIERLRNRNRTLLKNKCILKTKGFIQYLDYRSDDFIKYFNNFIDKPCLVCNNSIISFSNAQIDHVIPISILRAEEDSRVLNSLVNLRLICSHCNYAKIQSDKEIIGRMRDLNNGEFECQLQEMYQKQIRDSIFLNLQKI